MQLRVSDDACRGAIRHPGWTESVTKATAVNVGTPFFSNIEQVQRFKLIVTQCLLWEVMFLGPLVGL